MKYEEFIKKYILNENFKPKQINEIYNKPKLEHLTFDLDNWKPLLTNEATEEEKRKYVEYYSLMYGLGVSYD